MKKINVPYMMKKCQASCGWDFDSENCQTIAVLLFNPSGPSVSGRFYTRPTGGKGPMWLQTLISHTRSPKLLLSRSIGAQKNLSQRSLAAKLETNWYVMPNFNTEIKDTIITVRPVLLLSLGIQWFNIALGRHRGYYTISEKINFLLGVHMEHHKSPC